MRSKTLKPSVFIAVLLILSFIFVGCSNQQTNNPDTSTPTTSEPSNLTTSEPQTYTLSILSEGEGSFSGQGSYSAGDNVTISATEINGYFFSMWKIDEDTVTEPTYTFSMPAKDLEIKVTFLPYLKYSLNLYATTGGTIGGYYDFSNKYIIIDPEGNIPNPNTKIDVNVTENGSFITSQINTKKDKFVLNAVAKSGYRFDGWYITTSDGLYQDKLYSTDLNLTIFDLNYDGHISLTAKFSAIAPSLLYYIDVIPIGVSGGQVHCNFSQAKAGTIITLTAITVYPNIQFTGWYYNNQLLSTEKTYFFTMPANNVTIYAKFTNKN